MEPESPLEERIVYVLQHLGITQAHVAASVASDWQGLATRDADLIASLTIVCPSGLDPNDLSALASRLVVFTGDHGPQPERLRRALASFPDTALIMLPDYLGETWTDGAADRTREVSAAILELAPPTCGSTERKQDVDAPRG
jgi:hypothetical protein